MCVTGASGTGKSSLVFAGVVPALQKKDGDRWQVVPMRPRDGEAKIDKACASRGEKPLLLIVDQFEEMLEESATRPLVFALSLHGFIVGQPFRSRPLRQALQHCVGHKHADRVWFTRARDIAAHCMNMPAGILTGG